MTNDLAPGLLLAAPSLGDPNFERTVVLLGHHDGKGAMGWVLNGEELPPVDELLHKSGLVPKNTALPRRKAFGRPARVGGPVAPASGWIVYRRASAPLPGELAIGPELAITGDSDALAAVIRGEGPTDFRMLIGYAGWSPGQLEGEIQQGAWLPAPVDAGLVFETPMVDLWEEAYKRTVGASPGSFTSRRGQA